MRLTVIAFVVACTKTGSSPNEAKPEPKPDPAHERMSSIDESRMIESLSDAEAVQHCEEVLAYWRRQPGNPDGMTMCLATALGAVASSTADPQQACKAELSKCLANPPPVTCPPDKTTFNRHCKGITVGETNACQREVRDKVATRRDVCDEVTVDNIDAIRKAIASDLTTGPRCQRMRAACGL